MEIFKTTSEDDMRALSVPKACIKNRAAIIDLEKIIATREVCDPDKVDELINYHKTYISKRNRLLGGVSRPITERFFTKYAIQVAYVCKKNMIQNLEIARDELRLRSEVFEKARETVYNDEPSIKSNIKLIEEQPDDPVSTNVKPMDNTELTLSEYREALVRLKRAEDILTFDRDECAQSRDRETRIARDKLQLFFKPALICHQLNRYYAGSILSVARLANYGYTARDEELDSTLNDNPSLRDWIIAVQVCDPMLYIGTKEVLNDAVIIDTCTKKITAIEPMVYQDSIEELDNDMLEEMIPKSEATRAQAQKLMRSAMKKMAKINIMKQLRSGAGKRSIFTKSLSMFSTSNDLASAQHPYKTRKSKDTLGGFAVMMPNDLSNALTPNKDYVQTPISERESFEILVKIGGGNKPTTDKDSESRNDVDRPVSFDPVTSIITTLTVIAIMLCFEWLFFVVMTLAARLCHHLHFNFENLLSFPPKFLSWSDADFSRFNDKIEKFDEDDFLDYDELTPDELEQRDLLQKVFGRQPPMLFRD